MHISIISRSLRVRNSVKENSKFKKINYKYQKIQKIPSCFCVSSSKSHFIKLKVANYTPISSQWYLEGSNNIAQNYYHSTCLTWFILCISMAELRDTLGAGKILFLGISVCMLSKEVNI